MEFENTVTRPIPDYTLLKMEVTQQSKSCDIKVKSGKWEKLYHSCVLAKSPFFEHMMCSKFRESSTGTVELSVGTPATIDQTLMFLYGEEPKLTLKNIESFVELAEFLMLKNLKSFCMKWLRGVSVEQLTDDSCMSLLQLSTVYNITVPYLIKYIDAHLMSLIHNPQLISLDKPSVEYILFGKRLGYVPVDEKLKYFERWCQCHMDTISLQWVKEIVQKFNLHDVSKNILEDLVQRPPFDGLDCLKDALMNYSDSGSNMHKVLLMPDGVVKNCFWGLDLQQKHWYRIDPSYLTGKYMSTTVLSLKKAGLRTSSEMYFVNFRKIRDGGKRSSISCLNFVTGESNMYRVVLEFKPPCCDIKHFTMAGDLCFACININDDSRSLVYAGHVGRKSIHLSQLFSLRKGKIYKMCVNELSELAIIPNSKDYVLLYNFTELSLTKKNIRISFV
ncbi:uncharacterized protein LOC132722788 [Ruditapes philippinarum]|uniref:uncharacterized protein LOC132722788 n=1 Tax=Ruditapes philippinarum TaxID=129788 RepID=UPI00295B982D|nr:uncharacterized protein LOC132722788 [Ruditapes philippinarum]